MTVSPCMAIEITELVSGEVRAQILVSESTTPALVPELYGLEDAKGSGVGYLLPLQGKDTYSRCPPTLGQILYPGFLKPLFPLCPPPSLHRCTRAGATWTNL